MLRIFDLVAQVAPSRSTVLIQGESGTGKELIAKALHSNSPRKDKPFVAVNTGSMPTDLLESTLFGHERGAFTSAVAAKKGLFEVADQGTLFLDEIGTMSIDMQAKILRVLQDRRFMRLGGTQEIQVDVRIVAATNVNLQQAVKDGRFREDLFYRLNVISLELPPLRSRKEDIPLLVQHYLKFYAEENGFSTPDLTAEGLRILMEYEWPGNVRELENVIERCVVLSTGPHSGTTAAQIGPDLFPGQLRGNSYSTTLLEQRPDASLFDVMEDIERRIIADRLERCNWNQTDAAEYFRIPLSTLNQKIKRLNIEVRKRNRE
jgi:DNA-binding NtrC family response regulator